MWRWNREREEEGRHKHMETTASVFSPSTSIRFCSLQVPPSSSVSIVRKRTQEIPLLLGLHLLTKTCLPLLHTFCLHVSLIDPGSHSRRVTGRDEDSRRNIGSIPFRVDVVVSLRLSFLFSLSLLQLRSPDFLSFLPMTSQFQSSLHFFGSFKPFLTLFFLYLLCFFGQIPQKTCHCCISYCWCCCIGDNIDNIRCQQQLKEEKGKGKV